jgi:hypothetical protein
VITADDPAAAVASPWKFCARCMDTGYRTGKPSSFGDNECPECSGVPEVYGCLPLLRQAAAVQATIDSRNAHAATVGQEIADEHMALVHADGSACPDGCGGG